MDVDNATLIFINSISLRSFQKPHMIHIYLIYNSCFVSYQLHPRDPYSPISYPQFQYTRYFLGTFAHLLQEFTSIFDNYNFFSSSVKIYKHFRIKKKWKSEKRSNCKKKIWIWKIRNYNSVFGRSKNSCKILSCSPQENVRILTRLFSQNLAQPWYWALETGVLVNGR